MRQTFHSVAGCGRSVGMTDSVRVRARSSYLASRWVQAPITNRREADT
jgi:hypothetical protein